VLPEEEAARLEEDEAGEADTEELRTVEEPARVAEDAERTAADAVRVAVETEREGVAALRLTPEAEPAADGVVREAAAMRPEDLGAAEPEAAVPEPVPAELPAVRTTRPTPLRGLAGM